MAKTWTVTLRLPDGNHYRLHVGEDQTILDAALEAGIDLPSMCGEGWCLTCAARLIKGRVEHPYARRYYEADTKAGFILPCSAQPRADCIVQTHQKQPMVRYRVDHSLPAPRG